MPTIAAPTSRLVLRDGSSAGVRPATVSDRDAMHRFFDELLDDPDVNRNAAAHAFSDDAEILEQAFASFETGPIAFEHSLFAGRTQSWQPDSYR